MSLSAAAFLAEGLLEGVFDVFDAMTAKHFACSVSEDQPATQSVIKDLIHNYPLVMRGRPKSGGAIALLFSTRDATQLAALINEQPADDIDEQAVVAMLREVAEPCLGAGLTNLLEKSGKNPEQVQDIEALMLGAEQADDLLAFFQAPPRAVPFGYSESFEGSGCLLISQELERLVPQDFSKTETQALDSTPNGQLSDDEVNDILGNFGQPAQDVISAAGEHKRSGHSNLELVLDIRLVATARLGRIEMPIGDILALGPGSIIDVGRLVDEPVELLVNNKLIARGDVVVVDEKFGLRITEIISPKERIESMH